VIPNILFAGAAPGVSVEVMRLLAATLALSLASCTAGGFLGDDDDDPTPPDEPGPEVATAARMYAPDHVAVVHIEMDEADLFTLAGQTNSFLSLLEGEDCMDSPLGGDAFTWFEADVTVDGERIERVGVRKKGLIGSLSNEKPGLKVKFDKWVVDQSYGGLERLTLNNSVSDPSLVRQCLGYDLFRAAGIAAPRCSFAHVTVNEYDLGVYVNVEPVKKAFLRWAYNGDDEGDLYEGTVSDFREGFTRTFQPDTSVTDPTLAPIEAIREALEITDDDSMFAALEDVLDVDAFLRFWALEALVAHIDGYAGNRNNFYVYRPEGTDLVEFLPWGIDWTFVAGEAFGSSTERVVLANSALSRVLWETPRGRQGYLDAMDDLLDTVWDADHFVDEVDRMAALVEPFALPDGRRVAAQSDLRSFARNRAARMRALMSEPLPVFDQPLGGVLCLIERGSIRSEFSTPWGSLDVAPALDQGWSSTELTWDGESSTVPGGAVVGVAGNGQTLLATLGYLEPGLLLETVVSLPPWAQTQGAVGIRQGNPWTGVHTFTTATEQWLQIGRVWTGELTLSTYEPWAGGTVAGWIDGPVHSSEGL